MERLSPAEWELMSICWRLGRCTTRDVLEESNRRRVRDYRTVQTLMTRMVAKGYLRVEKVGKTNHFTPAIAEKRALRVEIRRFLDEVVTSEESRAVLQDMLARHKPAGARSSRRRRTTMPR